MRVGSRRDAPRLEGLRGGGLEYVLIGATAMGFHGIIRATEDVDLFVRATPENIERLRNALRAAYENDPSVDEIRTEDLPRDWSIHVTRNAPRVQRFRSIEAMSEAPVLASAGESCDSVSAALFPLVSPRASRVYAWRVQVSQHRGGPDGTAGCVQPGWRFGIPGQARSALTTVTKLRKPTSERPTVVTRSAAAAAAWLHDECNTFVHIRAVQARLACSVLTIVPPCR
jgi:hypothetical protein